MISLTYIARSFLDYRIPVFSALDELTNRSLHVIYSTGAVNPLRVRRKIENILGDRCIGLGEEIKIGAMDDPNFANSSFGIVYQPGLLSAIRQSNPAVIISDGFGIWTTFALLFRMLYGTPLVICYERTFHTERNAQWFRILYRKIVLRWVDAMACTGRLCAAYSERLGMAPERITMGHMVSDTKGLQNIVKSISVEERSIWRQRWGYPELIFLAVGKLIERKGLKQLLLAWALAEAIWKEKAVLIVVGDGPEREQLENQAAAAELKSVYFEGAVDYDRIAYYYSAADAFVIPTLEDNWSLVVPEAMACGLPILCSKYNGCWPELVTERNGWIFDPLDPHDTLRALTSCISKASELKNMGVESEAIIARHTPWHAAKSIYRACEIAMEFRAGEI